MFFLHVLLTVLFTSAAFGQDGDDTIADEYFVVLKDGLSEAEQNDSVEKLKNDLDITIKKVYQLDSVRLLYVSGSADNVNSASELPKVDFVERNAKVQAESIEPPCRKIPSQKTWGLDRIDQITKLRSTDVLDEESTYTIGQYRGAGVIVYILDTGIYIDHDNFDGHALWGYTSDFITEANEDLNGHGTHVAGIVGSQIYGVAKEAILKAVKVLNEDGSGSWASFIDGMFWVWQQHNQRKVGGNVPNSVVTLSFGGNKNLAANLIVKLLHDAGIVVVAAAGNDNSDACFHSPGGSAKEAITVGASTILDTTRHSTNWGLCVDIFAPGQEIESTGLFNSFQFRSGTSRAAAHVAGVVALKLSKETKSPQQIAYWLSKKATTCKLSFVSENHAKSRNKLLFVECLLE